MASLRELRLALTVKSDKFTRGMRQAKGSLSGFFKSASGGAASLGMIGGAAAAAGASMLALGAAVSGTAREIDKMAKDARRLGLATDELDKLQKAGQFAGVGISTVTMGLQRMRRRVSEAAKGTGEAQSAIKELGLDAKKLNKLDADKQFLAIAGAMQEVDNQGDKLRLLFKLFDSEGVALGEIMEDNASSIGKAEAAMRGFNSELSNMQAQDAEALTDSITRFKQQFSGGLRNIKSSLAPLMKDLVDFSIFFTGADPFASGSKKTAIAAAKASATGPAKASPFSDDRPSHVIAAEAQMGLRMIESQRQIGELLGEMKEKKVDPVSMAAREDADRKTAIREAKLRQEDEQFQRIADARAAASEKSTTDFTQIDSRFTAIGGGKANPLNETNNILRMIERKLDLTPRFA